MPKIYLLILHYLFIASAPLALNVSWNLEYEYALLVSWLSLVILPLSSLFLPLKALPHAPPTQPVLSFLWICFASPLFIFLPGSALFLANRCLCSPHSYLLWMFLLAYPAHILAHAISYAIIRGRWAALSKRVIFPLLLFGYLFSIGYGFIQLWVNPQKRIDHIILGFLHGPVYDFWIPIDLGILLQRVSILLFSCSLLLLAWLRQNWGTILMFCCFSSTAVTVNILSRSYPSTANTEKALLQSLYKTKDGKGFSLHYRPLAAQNTLASSDSYSEDQLYEQNIHSLFIDCQFHVDELTKILGESENLPHVKVFVYPSEDQKKLWFGGGSTDVTDVFTPSIHITLEGFPHPTLRHELVHALASGFGFHGLGFHPNIAFTEGLAIALAPSPGDLSLDEGAASLLESGRISSIETLFSPFFWQESGSRAYTTAGSFIKHLIDSYGFMSVKSLYSGKSFKKAVGKDQNEVVHEWNKKIMSAYDKKAVGMYTESLFRQGGVFQDRCPHTKKDYERPKSDGFFSRIRQPIDFQTDRDYLPWLASLNPDSLSVMNRMWRQEILRLGKERNLKIGRLETWLQTLKNARIFPPESIEDIEIAIQESDIHRLLGNRHESIELLKKIKDFTLHKNIGDGLLRFLLVRLLVEDIEGEKALPWRLYFARFKSDIPQIEPTIEGPWIFLYLKLRSVTPKIHFTTQTLTKLAHEGAPVPEELPDSFGREFYTLIGSRLMAENQYLQAEVAYQKAARYARSMHREHLLELARLARYRHGFPTRF